MYSFLCCARAAPLPAQDAGQAPQPPVLTLDLKGALERARNNSPELQSASLGVELAHEDRSQAKATFYPTLSLFNQYLYTQGNGTPEGVFVANDGVHVYSSQAVVHQELYAPGRSAEYHRSLAAEALAAAKREIAARGIVFTVIQNYYGLVMGQRKQVNAQQGLSEAQRFVQITRKLESGGEVARSDVVKAQLVLQQRQRELQDAELAAERARIELAVLLFPDYRTDFALVDDLGTVSPLPPLDQMMGLAEETSPDLRAAQEAVRQEEFGVKVAHSEYLPSLSFEYYFGINANQFAVRDPEGFNRLGSVAQATLNVPVFNWWTTRSKVRQADLRQQQAQLDLILAHRQLNSNLRTLHAEARSAWAQLGLLRQSVDLSEESLRLTNLRYEAGEATVLEVVDAQATLVQAHNDYDDGLTRYRIAFANLQTLTGNY